MNIVVYGGRDCSKEYYDEVYKFVKTKINNQNNNIIIGGNRGILEAVSKAGKQKEIKIISVILSNYIQTTNDYIDTIIVFENELDRMKYIIENGNIFLVLDGDIGTLEELFLTWVCAINNDKKIYLISQKINSLLNFMYENDYLSTEYKDYIKFVSMEELNF